jgi:hypothetical protein
MWPGPLGGPPPQMSAPWGKPVIKIVKLRTPESSVERPPTVFYSNETWGTPAIRIITLGPSRMDIYGKFRKSDRIEDRRNGFQPTAFPWFMEQWLEERPGLLSREAGLDDIEPKKKKRPKGPSGLNF